jgi:hypothetical protein
MRRILFLLFLCAITNLVYAQSDMIGYGLYKTLPQANQLNPALLPDYKVSIGLPGLAGFKMNLSQNFTNLEILSSKNEDGTMDLANIYDNLKRNNRTTANATANIFHIGIRGLNSYTSFSINTRSVNRLSFPKELVDLAYFGNASEQVDVSNLDFSRLSFKSNTFTEIGLSHGRSILNDKMTVGARFKVLIGHAYADISDFNLSLNTYGNADSIRLSTEGFTVRAGGIAGLLAQGGPDDEIASSLLANKGIAFDLGATYQFNRKIKFFGSINDLGFISWKDYTYQANAGSSGITFTGADVFGQSIEDEIDSLISDFPLEEIENGAFTNALTANIYLGGSYKLSYRQTASAILYSELYKGSLLSAFTAMYNFQYNTFFNTALAATIMNGRINNIGAGFTLNLIPFQICLTTNDLLSIVNPIKGRSVDLRFGINFTFGNVNKGNQKGRNNAGNTIDTIDLGID